ncbi:MAG TPA: carboxypeptidase regulatory-like domain-containing protein [Terriglobia bacterium]|nr:carboxypeptidase regulatory-like domain-containing protein [Terriglobia bacterium]
MRGSTPLLLLALVAAQAQAPAEKARIAGLVIRADTGEAVARARVTLAKPQAITRGKPLNAAVPSIFSDSGGRFVFTDLEPGTYWIQAEANGYLPLRLGGFDSVQSGVKVMAGQAVGNLTVRMTRAATISGRLLDRSGRPLMNVPLQLLSLRRDSGVRVLTEEANVQTDDRGQYRIYWVPPGRYYLWAGSTWGQSTTREFGKNTNPPGAAFYPGVEDPQAARMISVGAGSQVESVDWVLPTTTQTYHARIRLIDAQTGSPPSSASVTISRHTPGFGWGLESLESARDKDRYDASTGIAEFLNLLPATYLIQAGAQGASGQTTVTITNADVDGIAVALFPPISVRGLARVSATLPNGLSFDNLGITLTAAEWTHHGAAIHEAAPDPDGVFEFKNLPSGDYRLTDVPIEIPSLVRNPASAAPYIKEAYWGGANVLNQVFHISGSNSFRLDIVLGAADSVVAGVVRDQRAHPVPYQTVVLAPQEAREHLGLYRKAVTDEKGGFSIDEVIPGSYRLFAWEALSSSSVGDWFDPMLLVETELLGTPVHVDESSRVNAEVKLIPLTASAPEPIVLSAVAASDSDVDDSHGGFVSGWLSDEVGAPAAAVPLALVRFSYDASGSTHERVVATAISDDRGMFRLFALPPGKYYLRAGGDLPSAPGTEGSIARFTPNRIALNYPITYYPGAPGVADAEMIEVKPGEAGDEIHLNLGQQGTPRSYSVKGRIRDPRLGQAPQEFRLALTDVPAARLIVTNGRVPAGGAGGSYDPSSGSFELRNVTAGEHTLTAQSNDPQFPGWALVAVSVLSADEEGIELTLAPPLAIQGRLRMESSTVGPPSALPDGLKIFLHSAPNPPLAAYKVVSAVAGDFRIEDLAPGTYSLSLSGLPSGLYIDSAHLGSVDIFPAFTVNGSEGNETLDIVIGSRPGQIRGAATPGSQVVLMPNRNFNRADLFRSAIAEDDGHFTISTIVPGDYRIIAWQGLEPYSYFDPHLILQAEEQGRLVHVPHGSTQNIPEIPLTQPARR